MLAGLMLVGGCGDGNATGITDTSPFTATGGTQTRPANATCLAPDRPPAPGGVVATHAYTSLSFSSPVAIKQAPADNRWFIAEQGGKVLAFEASDDVTTATTVIDLSATVVLGSETGLLDFAFHPEFAKNREIFLSYNARVSGDLAMAHLIDLDKAGPAELAQALADAGPPIARYGSYRLALHDLVSGRYEDGLERLPEVVQPAESCRSVQCFLDAEIQTLKAYLAVAVANLDPGCLDDHVPLETQERRAWAALGPEYWALLRGKRHEDIDFLKELLSGGTLKGEQRVMFLSRFGVSYLELATVYAAQGDWITALAQLDKAVVTGSRAARQLPDSEHGARGGLAAARALARQDRDREAIEVLRPALYLGAPTEIRGEALRRYGDLLRADDPARACASYALAGDYAWRPSRDIARARARGPGLPVDPDDLTANLALAVEGGSYAGFAWLNHFELTMRRRSVEEMLAWIASFPVSPFRVRLVDPLLRADTDAAIQAVAGLVRDADSEVAVFAEGRLLAHLGYRDLLTVARSRPALAWTDAIAADAVVARPGVEACLIVHDANAACRAGDPTAALTRAPGVTDPVLACEDARRWIGSHFEVDHPWDRAVTQRVLEEPDLLGGEVSKVGGQVMYRAAAVPFVEFARCGRSTQ